METTTAASGPLFLSSGSPGRCVLLSAPALPPCSSLFPLPRPGAILFPTQRTANLRTKTVHLPLREVITLVFSTPLASSNPLALRSIPGCCRTREKDKEFPLPQGGEEAAKSSPAKHSTLPGRGGRRDQLLQRAAIWPSQIATASPSAIGGRSLGFHRKQRESYQLCRSVIFSNRWSQLLQGQAQEETDI